MYMYFVIISRRCANIQKFETNQPVVNSESLTPQKERSQKIQKVSFHHRHAMPCLILRHGQQSPHGDGHSDAPAGHNGEVVGLTHQGPRDDGLHGAVHLQCVAEDPPRLVAGARHDAWEDDRRTVGLELKTMASKKGGNEKNMLDALKCTEMSLNDPKKMTVTLSMANKVEQSGTKCPSHIDMLAELEEETPKKNTFH